GRPGRSRGCWAGGRAAPGPAARRRARACGVGAARRARLPARGVHIRGPFPRQVRRALLRRVRGRQRPRRLLRVEAGARARGEGRGLAGRGEPRGLCPPRLLLRGPPVPGHRRLLLRGLPEAGQGPRPVLRDAPRARARGQRAGEDLPARWRTRAAAWPAARRRDVEAAAEG
ncbi:unnamed protein product, partial [Prorocentrum cordatum]